MIARGSRSPTNISMSSCVNIHKKREKAYNEDRCRYIGRIIGIFALYQFIMVECAHVGGETGIFDFPMNELPKMNSPLKHLDPNIDVSDSTLSSILVQLGYAVREANSIRFLLRDVELKYIIAKSKSKSHVYFVGFVFDPNCAGKLVRLTSRIVSDIVTVVISSLTLNSESTIILVGKKGSRKDNRFPFTCTPGALYNVVIREFTSQDNILSYLSNLLSDTDKIESRYDTCT